MFGRRIGCYLGIALEPAVEATEINRPQPGIWFNPSRRVRKTPVRFTAIIAFHRAKVTCAMFPEFAAPALAITTSQGPAAANIAATEASSVTSACTANAIGSPGHRLQRRHAPPGNHHFGPSGGKAQCKVLSRARLLPVISTRLPVRREPELLCCFCINRRA